MLFMGCSPKKPITWQERVVEATVVPLPLAYEEYGKEHNETLLFLHGFGESKESWRFLVPELSKHYHLVLLDLKGFGDSPQIEDEGYSVYDHAKVVSAFIQQKRLNNLTIVGHSLGGGVALVLALMQRDNLIEFKIRRLILIDSIAYKQQLPSMLRVLNRPIIGYLAIHLISNDWMAKEAYRYAFYNDALIPKESVEHASMVLSKPLSKYVFLESVNQLIPDDIETMEQRYREITLPVLLLWGKEDVSIRLSIAYRLHKDLKNSTLILLPYVGHMPQEEAPSKVVEIIMEFMEENR